MRETMRFAIGALILFATCCCTSQRAKFIPPPPFQTLTVTNNIPDVSIRIDLELVSHEPGQGGPDSFQVDGEKTISKSYYAENSYEVRVTVTRLDDSRSGTATIRGGNCDDPDPISLCHRLSYPKNQESFATATVVVDAAGNSMTLQGPHKWDSDLWTTETASAVIN